MKRFRGCLMVAFIFACGLLVGFFLGMAMGWIGFFHKVVKGGPGAVRDLVVERAVQDLKLQPAQKVRVRQIIEETGAELAAATAEVRPKVEEIIGRGEDRIRETLDAKQRTKFDGFVNQGRRRWKAAVEANTPPAPGARQDASPPPATDQPERSGEKAKDL